MTNKFTREFVKKFITKNLGGETQVEFIFHGGNGLNDLDDVKSLLNTCEKIVLERKELKKERSTQKQEHFDKKKKNNHLDKRKDHSDKLSQNGNIKYPCHKHHGKRD